MIVLDAFAVLAFVMEEPAAAEVHQILVGPEGARLTALGVADVLDHLVRVVGAEPDEAVLDLAELGLPAAVAIDEAGAVRAGLLRARHYHRRQRAVSLADCAAAEVVQRHDATLATADPHLLDLGHAEGIDLRPLRDTTGTLWAPAPPTLGP